MCTIPRSSAVDFRQFVRCLFALKILVMFFFVIMILVTLVVLIYHVLVSEKFHYAIVVFVLFIYYTKNAKAMYECFLK